MSYPNDTPGAAWYPDPQTPGLVRWWDGTKWTEHVSVPPDPMSSEQDAPGASVPQIAEADAALAAADAEHAAAEPAAHVATYIGRHAAGPTPAPRQAARIPQIRPRLRVEIAGGSLLSA
jgi:hypothetical protein